MEDHGHDKPISQFKLARQQARAEREAAAGRATGEGISPGAPAMPKPAQGGVHGAAASPENKVDAHPAVADKCSVDSGGLRPSVAPQTASTLPAQPLVSQKQRAASGSTSVAGSAQSNFRGQREETVEEKIERYSKFVDKTLRVKLAQALEQRGEVVQEIESYEKLGGTVKVMRESKSSQAKSMVNIGCELYMQASIPDTSRIMINIGLGFFVEFTLAGTFVRASTRDL